MSTPGSVLYHFVDTESCFCESLKQWVKTEILALCDIPLSTLEQLLPPQVSLKLSFEVVGIRPYQQNIVFPLLKLPEQNCTLSFQLAVFCKLMKGFLFRISAKTEVRQEYWKENSCLCFYFITSWIPLTSITRGPGLVRHWCFIKQDFRCRRILGRRAAFLILSHLVSLTAFSFDFFCASASLTLTTVWQRWCK